MPDKYGVGELVEGLNRADLIVAVAEVYSDINVAPPSARAMAGRSAFFLNT
ncbi:hypothetical protein [Pseudomonas sp. G2-4]|uniref:hypothetical protein n=1 Tax=Pseudomonas sp. G2-4 TaxID=1506334 RepID=UPI0024B8C087|nr:hypothetical protein [Pseudomonas sp. G2-4]WHS62284.1 hypothetical protein QNH97_09625 [Pseudomonas sp. G2-4]